MTRSSENRCFRRFQQTRDPRLLAKVFDATAAELLRVAGHLSNGDRELTQDALQATFLTAIEKAASYDTERDVRPWLLGILANHVRKERRRTVRHRGADVTEAGLPANDSPVADVQGAEFGVAAKAAMKKLPAPFKEVVVLHLQHGLTATEIGEALGRPAGTVRTQIVRGMDRLRALLPAGFTAAALGMMLTPGPILAAVRSNVLATLPPVAVASSSFVLTGWRLYAMVAASLTVVLSVLFSLLADPVPLPPVNSARIAEDSPGQAAADVGAPRELIAEAPPEAVELPSPQLQPKRPANLQRVALKVVYDSDGKPAANVPIGMRVNSVVQTWHTNEAGRLELFLPWPGMHTIYALGTNAETMFFWAEGQRRPRVHKARIEIPRGANIDVHVTDPEGNPVAGATVESIGGRQLGGMLTVLGQTDATGRLLRRDVAIPRQMRVWADGFVPGTMRQVGGEVGKTCNVHWQLSGPAHTAHGRVVDEQGQPIPNAKLALVQLASRPDQPLYLDSDDEGNFELSMLRKGRHVLVGHNGQDGSEQLRRGELRFSHDGFRDKQIELRLTRGARVIGRLQNAAGLAMPRTNVVARSRPEGVGKLPFFETFTRTDRTGNYVLDALAPGRYDLESDKMETHSVELRDGETYEWNPVLPTLVPISIRLLDASGKPLEGWRVMLARPGTRHPSSGNSTGSDGRLLYPVRDWQFKPGGYCSFFLYKKLDRTDERWGDYGPLPSLVTPPMIVGQEHEVRVPKSAHSMHSLTGILHDHTGAALKDSKVEMAGPHGWLLRVEASVNEETGAFQFDDLPAGRYQAFVRTPGRPSYYLAPIHVGREPVATFGVVAVPDAGRVTVTLPAPEVGLTLQLRDSQQREFPLSRQKDGSWRSNMLFHGDYEVRGWSAETLVTPKAFKLEGAAQRVEVATVPHQATKVIVELPASYPRDGAEWRAEVVARVGGKLVCKRKLRHEFAPAFSSRMEFLVQLPPGVLDLRVKCWRNQVGVAKLEVAAGGGGEVVVTIR
tara:strand:+ start:31085 stop:34114 length:3030 start_codon:yes stop_codon:yes gene_type:complete